jgi:hypothetical protein
MAATSSPIWQWILSIAVPALSALAGILVGARLSARREAVQRRHAFIERQLKELYSPLLGMREEIRALGDVRVKVSKTGDSVWREMCDRYQTSPDALARFSEDHKESFAAEIEYNNKQFREVLLPAYQHMVATFRNNLWLAEPETRSYFSKLVEFVELWVRWLANTIPPEVMHTIDLRESKLHPFYDHLASTHDRLQATLKKGGG